MTDPADDDASTEATDEQAAPAAPPEREDRSRRLDKVPMRMLNDRILVKLDAADEERRSAGGILIPATAQIGKRLAWAEVRAAGPNVRAIQEGDHVLFNPEDVYEVEVRADTFIILRERDIHAVAAERLEEGHTGLYL
jgi:chaperonin GroES